MIECEVVDLTSSEEANRTHPDAMGRYLKLLDPVYGKVAYQKKSENANYFIFWRNRDGWTVKLKFYSVAPKSHSSR